MAQRKYEYYELATTNDLEQTFENYHEAFAAFQAARNGNDHATLWGVDEMGEMEVILVF